MPRRRTPIVTFLTDFGTQDAYVAAMKAAVLRQTRDVHLIDITHEISPQDVLAGSIALERAVASFPPGTIHVAVVDPGVGTDRRLLAVSINSQWVLCPDNGLITWAWRRMGGSARELTWRPRSHSRTFHGRDILAPAAGMLAAGKPLATLSRTLSGPLLLDLIIARGDEGAIIHFDRFGNATTNIPAGQVPPNASIRLRKHNLGRLRRTYGEVPVGKPLALIGSSDLLEIAVRNGSARRELKLSVGDRVSVRPDTRGKARGV